MPTRRELANAIRALAMDAVAEGQFRPSRACRWAWPTSPRCCGATPARTTRPIRTGPTATASCCRTATARCCCTALLHLTGYDLADRGAQALPPARLADAGPSGVRPRRRASRRRPGRWARASPTRSAWRSRRSCWPPQFNRPGHRDRRPPHLRVPGRRLPDGRHLARGLLARRHAGPRQADRLLRRQRHLDRRRGARAGSPTTRRSASRPTAGT